jgi:hypothetical protein
MRARVWLALIVLVAAGTAAWAAKPAPPAPPPAPPAADELVYPGATVETRIDVNGVAAMQLAGGAVDALTEQIQSRMEAARAAEAAAATAQGADAQAQRAAAQAQRAAAQAIEQTRDALKSLTGVKVLIMTPKVAPNAAEFVKHYQGLMAPRGWTSLVTIQSDEDKDVVLVMLGPGGKGLFAAVGDKEDIVTAMITTSMPIGDLIGTMMRSGSIGDVIGPLVGPLTGMFGKAGPPKPPAPPEATAPSTAPAPEAPEE